MSDFVPLTEVTDKRRLKRDLAEVFLMLDFLSSHASGRDWSVNAPTVLTPNRPKSSAEPFWLEEIEASLENPTALVRRICAIKEAIVRNDFSRDWLSDAAFLLRAKEILNDRASPATSTTIAFTAMVFNESAKDWWQESSEKESPDLERNPQDMAEIAFPSLRVEAQRLSKSIRYVIPVTIAFVMMMVVVIAGFASVPSASPYRWLAEAAYSTAVLPALLGFLGASAAMLRRFQQLTAAHLLNPRERNSQTVEGCLGFLAGTTVWLLVGGGLADRISLTLLVFPLAFLAGYSTELVFSLLDGLIARISRSALAQNRPQQMNVLIKNQTAIASTVSEIHNQIEQFQGNITLDPFEGVVIVRLRRSGSDPVPIREQTIPAELSDSEKPAKVTGALLAPDQPYDLFVTLDRRPAVEKDAVVEPLTTGSGGPPVSVTFEVNINARGVSFAQKAQEITIERRSQSSACVYSFRAPSLPGRYDIFAEISQKKRLAQVALLPVIIENVAA